MYAGLCCARGVTGPAEKAERVDAADEGRCTGVNCGQEDDGAAGVLNER